MAFRRLFHSAMAPTIDNRKPDVNDDSNSTVDYDLSISVNGSNGGASFTSSPVSKSRNSLLRDRQSLRDQQQRRRPCQSSCSIHRALQSVMLLCCVAFLSYTMSWNDMLAQRQQTTLSPLGSELRTQKLSLIPSIDELSTSISSQSLREEIARRQAASSAVDDNEGTEESSDVETDITEIAVTEPTSTTKLDDSLTRPPLDTIIDDDNEIIGDPEWLLDFAILGYGKCGTSTMMHWLREHPEIQAFGREKGHFMSRKPGLMIRQLYEQLDAGPYQRGYKAPQDVTQTHILNYYRTYWPNAKLILGIRHPVPWFESLYNFRIQNLNNPTDLPRPNDLIGPCRQGRYLTCTNKGDFANSLMKLGQQNYPKRRPATELELSITRRYNRTTPFDSSTVEYMYNPIFIFELDQLGDENVTRKDLFRSDFTKFMGLKEPLPALPHYKPGKARETAEQVYRDTLKIKICDDEFITVRNELMILARATSQWIREVFLNGPTVHVSSKEYFISILEGWMEDPCDNLSTPSITEEAAREE